MPGHGIRSLARRSRSADSGGVIQPRRVLSVLTALLSLALLAATHARAGGDSSLDYAREFITRYPNFTAEGTMTSTLPGKPPYRCRIEIVFKEEGSMKFLYNTNAAKNIIPYDYAYAGRKLTETVYNRTRTETVSETEVGAPNRTVFNFVWDLLSESQKGAGFRSLVLNGLMSVERQEANKRTRITLERRFPTIPVKSVVFTFDANQQLKFLNITQADGATHRIEILRFHGKETKITKENS